MMRSTKKSTASSPRSSRGLELLLWGGIVALLGFGIFHRRTDGSVPGNHPPVPFAVKNTAAVDSVRRPATREKTPRETLLEKTLAGIAAEEDSGRREEMLAALADQIPITDIQTTLNELQNLVSAGVAGEFSQRLLRRWTESDGHAAAAWAEQLPAGPARDAAISGVAIEWANASLADATAWTKTLGDEAERNATMLSVANEAVRAEPVEALRLAMALPDTLQRDELIRRAAMEWAAQDAQGAVAWAEQISDETLRAKVLAGETVSWAEQNPEAAATLAVEQLPAGRLQNDAVVSIIQRWAQQQPETAAAWVEQFPNGPLRDAAEENLLAQVAIGQ